MVSKQPRNGEVSCDVGYINHFALCVSDLNRAMDFYRPIFEFLGYKNADSIPGIEIWESPALGTAINLWQAKQEFTTKENNDCSPGLHHLAFNTAERNQVDGLFQLLNELKVEVSNPPAEYT